MAQNTDITTDELLKNKVIAQSDLDEYKNTGSFSDTAKAKSRAYYVNKKAGTNISQPPAPSIQTWDTANSSTANTISPSSNIWNVIAWQNYTSTSTWTTPTEPPVVSTATTSTTPWGASSGWQPDATANALAGQKAVITSQQNDIISDKNKLITDTAEDNKKYLADLEKSKADIIKAEEDANKKIEELQKSEEIRAKSILDEQNKQLLDEQIASVNDLEAQKAQQKLVDEQNVKNQQIANDVAKQQSAWAFAKLWLSFSSWAIIQSQQIAQDWAYAISLAESNVVKNQTAIVKDIVETKNKYTAAINDNINKYNDLTAKYKEYSINRINSLTLNRMKSSEEILKEKKQTADDFRKTIIDLEKQFRYDQKTLADDAVKNAENIRLNSDRIRNEKLTNMQKQLASWELSRMTTDQITKLEDELNVPQWFIKSEINRWISEMLRKELDNIAWSDYFPTNMNDLIAKVKEQMSQGRDLTASLNFVLSNDSKTNPNLKNAMQSKVDKSNLDAEKLQLEREKFEFDKWVTGSEFKETYWVDLGWVIVSSWTWNTRADRNNNPWNLRVEGSKWKDSWWFGIFSTPEEWFNAMVQDVSAKVNWGSRYSAQIKTLKNLIEVYAPAKDKNDPNNYSNIVAKSLWISPDEPIANLKWREVELAQAMAKHEWWSWTFWKSTTKEELTDLANMTSAELRAYAGRNWIDFKDSQNNNTLRANIEWAIKIADAMKQGSDLKKWEDTLILLNSWKKISADWYKSLIETVSDDTTKNLIKVLWLWNKTATNLWRIDYKTMSVLDNKTQQTVRFLQRVWQVIWWKDMLSNTKLLNSTEQEQLKNNLSAMIEWIENATVTDMDRKSWLRERYLADYLKPLWIKYNKEKDYFYLQALWGDIKIYQ